MQAEQMKGVMFELFLRRSEALAAEKGIDIPSLKGPDFEAFLNEVSNDRAAGNACDEDSTRTGNTARIHAYRSFKTEKEWQDVVKASVRRWEDALKQPGPLPPFLPNRWALFGYVFRIERSGAQPTEEEQKWLVLTVEIEGKAQDVCRYGFLYKGEDEMRSLTKLWTKNVVLERLQEHHIEGKLFQAAVVASGKIVKEFNSEVCHLREKLPKERWDSIVGDHLRDWNDRMDADEKELISRGVPPGAIVYVKKNAHDGMGIFYSTREEATSFKLRDTERMWALHEPFQLDEFAFDGRDVLGLMAILEEVTKKDAESHLEELVAKGCISKEDADRKMGMVRELSVFDDEMDSDEDDDKIVPRETATDVVVLQPAKPNDMTDWEASKELDKLMTAIAKIPIRGEANKIGHSVQ